MASGWYSYISNKAVDFSSNFHMSFDLNLKGETLLLGVHGTGNPGKKTSVSNFTSTVQRSLLVSADLSSLAIRGQYEVVNGSYVAKKVKDNTEFFGLKMEIDRNRIYEEVKDISKYDPYNVNYLIKYKTLYTKRDDKYVILSDGRIALKVTEFPAVTCLGYEAGKVIHESYYADETFIDSTNPKFKMLIGNTGRVFSFSKKGDKAYVRLKSFMQNNSLESGYILLAVTKQDVASNISVNGAWK